LLPALACAPPDGGVELGEVELASAATTRGAAPMFLVTPLGEQLLSWVAEDPTGRANLFLQVTDPQGRAGPVSSLRDPLGDVEPHGEAPPRLAASAEGAIYVLYTVGKEVPGERFPRSALRFARSEDRGRTWSEPLNVNEGERFGSHNFHALLAGPGGRVWAAWLSSTEGQSGVWLRRSTDGGRTWAPAANIDPSEACPCCRTGLALGPDGSLYVSWRGVLAGGVRDVVVMRSPDGGESWERPVRPRADGWVIAACPHAGPALAIDRQGRVHVAWWTGKEGEAGVYYARSEDGGRVFASQPIATGLRSAPAHVQLALGAGGQVLVVWDDGLGRVPRILMRRSDDGGRGFGRRVVLSSGGRAATFPVAAVVRDSLFGAWSEVGEEAHHAALAARPDMGDPRSVMPLPRVGQSEIFLRRGPLAVRRDGQES
jgi:hypothetical protein